VIYGTVDGPFDPLKALIGRGPIGGTNKVLIEGELFPSKMTVAAGEEVCLGLGS